MYTVSGWLHHVNSVRGGLLPTSLRPGLIIGYPEHSRVHSRHITPSCPVTFALLSQAWTAALDYHKPAILSTPGINDGLQQDPATCMSTCQHLNDQVITVEAQQSPMPMSEGHFAQIFGKDMA